MQTRRSMAYQTRHGYVAVPPIYSTFCNPPIDPSTHRLTVSKNWALTCFFPQFQRARIVWGAHAESIVSEILGNLMPSMHEPPQTSAERELRRRVELAVAILLNGSGVITPYPAAPQTPRPYEVLPGPSWINALLTGWAR